MYKVPATILDYTEKWLDIIHKKDDPTPETADWIIRESLHNFESHFNA